jgi:nickel/cobalt transporter (NicO) family protein
VNGMNSAFALVLAAAGVGFGHAVLPDHWAPLAVLSRSRKDPLHRVVRRSLAAAGTHVALSLLLGAVLIAVGLGFRGTVLRYEDYVVGGILLATGAVFLVLELTGRGHGHSHEAGHGHSHAHEHNHEPGHTHAQDSHHDHGHAHEHGDGHSHPHGSPRVGRLQAAAALAVPFGAAASPDLTILPVFLAASALGAATAVGSLLVFAGVTVATMVGLTVAASLGVARLTAPWIERRANLLTALTLLLFGTLIALGLL